MAEASVYVLEQVNFSDVASGPGQEVRNTHINIGTGKEVSIRRVAELIKEKIGYRGEIYFNAAKPDGTMRKLTDPSKIHGLGWHHKIEIDEGVERLYTWYVNNQQ